MSTSIKKQIGIIFAALAAIGAELMGEPATTGKETTDKPADNGGATEEPPKRRGRPPGGGASAETPAGDAGAKTGGKTYDELREVIAPLIKDNQGEAVKAAIAKYATGGGGLKELATLPQHHAAFIKDIEALSY